MACLTTTIHTQNDLTVNSTLQLRFGERAISLRKDFRKRFYHTNPIVECHAGVKAGHLEILLFRHWVIVFSKAQNYRCSKPGTSMPSKFIQ